MTGQRRALIIANDTYDHASLAQLRAPAADAEALAAVLGDPDVGGFSVGVVHNEPSHEVQAQIEDAFAVTQSDDLLLLHFSGHGIKSDTGELFLAARNTRPDRLASTGVSADFIQRCMRTARARSIVLLLDCCYGGAFGEGVAVRAAGPVNVMDSFPSSRLGGGRGRAVISASSAIEYAFEGTTLAANDQAQPSVFTSAVVDGLRTGEADRDEDGLVSLDELYNYVFDRVRAENPKQTPGRDVEMAGDLFIARSQRRRLRPQPIPDAVAAALRESNPTFRRGAVSELRDRLWHEDPATALGALEALREVARTDTKAVADDAAAAIASVSLVVVPVTVRFDPGPGERSVTLEAQGPALAREVTAKAERPLEATVGTDGRVTVVLGSSADSFEGEVTISSPVGSVVVPVLVAAEPAAPTAAGDPPGQTAALVERRITPVAEPVPGGPSPAGPSPVAEPRAPEPRAPEPGAPAPLTRKPTGSESVSILQGRAKLLMALTAMLGGLLILASYAFPWVWGGRLIALAPGLLTGLFVLALMATMAGLSSFLDPRGLVASGLVLGVAVVAVNGTLTAFGVMATQEAASLGTGWVLGLLGQLLVVLSGITCLVILVRGRHVSLAWPTRPSRTRLVVIALVVVCAGFLVAWTQVVATVASDTPWPAITTLWPVATLAVGAVVVSTTPTAVGRAMLAGWALAALSQPLSDLDYLGQVGDPGAGRSVLLAILVLLLLLVPAAIALDRRGTSHPADAS